LRAAGDGAVIDGVDIGKSGNTIPRPELARVLEDIIGDGGWHDEKSRVSVAKGVVLVDRSDSPTPVGELLADSLPLKLGFGVVKLPAVHGLFVLQRLVAKSIELLHGSQPARSRLDELKGVARNLVVFEVERDKREVSASNTYGRGLPRGRGHGPEVARRQHRKGDPSLTDLGRRRRVLLRGVAGDGRLRDGRAKDEVVIGEPQGAICCLTTVNALDIFDDLSGLHVEDEARPPQNSETGSK
jgi:hypothetical protein